jgi:hypothetical protein
VKVFQKEGQTRLDVSQGAICSKIVEGSPVRVYALGRALDIQAPFEGTVSLDASGKPAIRRTSCSRHKAFLIPVVGGAAAAAGLAAAAVSPSQD